MLSKLDIRNYAIIEEISISFSPGLNIITGETGAGKSILAGALTLVLGERFESAALPDKEKKCMVEAAFDVKKNAEVQQFLKDAELDAGDELYVRREVTAGGKSRAFVNDTPVNLNQLKLLGALLVDLHQQFDTLELGDNSFQRRVLDALAENMELLKQYSVHYRQLVKTRQELDALKQQQQNASAMLDYNQFLYNELEEAGLHEDELENLEASLKLLNNAEHIKTQLNSLIVDLAESDKPVIPQLKSIVAKLNAAASYHEELPALTQRLQSALLEAMDIADELEKIADSIQHDPEKIAAANDKLSAGYKLLKKHNVKTTAELLPIKDDLEQKLQAFTSIADEIIQAEKATAALQKTCEEVAAKIAANRNKAIVPFTKNVNQLLAQVGMPNAQIAVQLNKTGLTKDGTEETEFLFDANKSGRFEPLRKVASGGELSRLMLCIKSLVVKKLELPVLIFDEIDTGISGEAAKQVGIIMKSLSKQHQVISITHQPQIAARGDAHYFVYKAQRNQKISTSIRLLTGEERVVSIAQMLSGEKPTSAALENAREMVEL